MTLVGMGFTLLFNIGTVGYVYGNVSTRLTIAEKAIDRAEQKVDAMQTVRIEMAGVKEQLSSINDSLRRLEQQLSRGAK